jgi:hypothetical protein
MSKFIALMNKTRVTLAHQPGWNTRANWEIRIIVIMVPVPFETQSIPSNQPNFALRVTSF